MKIVDKTKDKQEEQWQLGDVLTNEDHYYGLIVRNKDNDFCGMDITNSDSAGSYSTKPSCLFGFTYKRITELKKLMLDEDISWHKVNAKLVIE